MRRETPPTCRRRAPPVRARSQLARCGAVGNVGGQRGLQPSAELDADDRVSEIAAKSVAGEPLGHREQVVLPELPRQPAAQISHLLNTLPCKSSM